MRMRRVPGLFPRGNLTQVCFTPTPPDTSASGGRELGEPTGHALGARVGEGRAGGGKAATQLRAATPLFVWQLGATCSVLLESRWQESREQRGVSL